jgi:hypothetical protein
MSRSGDEPAHARSPLGLRLGLATFGLVCGIVGVLLFAGTEEWPVVGLFAVVGVVAAVDAGVVIKRIRQGPHWQPGPDVPPYRPVEPEKAPREPRQEVPVETRVREYLLLMGTCLGLLLVAWVGLRLVSTTAAVVVTVVAMVIPPVAAIVANRQER